MISVVMATYNGEKYIEKQLQTILNQTLSPDEVIIRDDCSNDKTVSIIEGFIENNNLNNWDVKVNEHNLGYRKNFEELLNLAQGDYIFLSDQDDEWLEDKLKDMVEIFQKNKKIQSLNGGIELINDESQKIEVRAEKNMYNANLYFSTKSLSQLSEISLSDLVISNITPGCAMAITKKLRDSFLETYDAKLPHDWYLNMIAAHENGCYFLNRPVIDYRIHANNTIGITETDGILQKFHAFDMKQRIIDFQLQVDAIDGIERDYGELDEETKYTRNFLSARIKFYKEPSFSNFNMMRQYRDYRERTAIKGKIWDWVIALKIDKILYLFERN